MSVASSTIRSRGRPRSEERTRSILGAVLAELVEVGYDGMTIENVAARAGTSKPTIYRRWASKAEIVAEAIEQHAFSEIPLEDTGNIEDDVRRWLRALQRALSGIDGDLLVAITAERIRHPELAAAFDRRFIRARRERLREMLRTAVDRGQLEPSTDVELLADLGPALLLQHVAQPERPSGTRLADRIVAQFFRRPSPH
jgi:AcrR family transcriptional regulator